MYKEDVQSGNAAFIAETTAYNNGRAIYLPAGMRVKDMTIYSEYVIFCGSYDSTGGPYGFVGILNIPNAFDWGQNMCYSLYDPITISGVTKKITSLNRLDFYVDYSSANGQFKVAMIGDYEMVSQSGHLYGSAVCEAAFGYLMWTKWVHYSLSDNYIYTDVAVTDNKVVVVGRSTYYSDMIVTQFDKTHPFVDHYCSYPFVISDGNIGGVVRVDAVEADVFATASHYSDVESGTTVKLFDAGCSSLSLLSSVRMPQLSNPKIPSTWQMRELCYDPVLSELYVLQDADWKNCYSFASYVSLFPVSSFSLGAPQSIGDKDKSLCDLNLKLNGGLWTVGTKSGILTYTSNNIMSNYYNCECSAKEEIVNSQPQLKKVSLNWEKYEYDVDGSTYLFNPIDVIIKTICYE